MNDNVVLFPARDSNGSDRIDAVSHGSTDANALAASLGSPDEWAASAILYLKGQSVGAHGQIDGLATVSRASLHVVLAYVERLEARLGLIPDPGSAA